MKCIAMLIAALGAALPASAQFQGRPSADVVFDFEEYTSFIPQKDREDFKARLAGDIAHLLHYYSFLAPPPPGSEAMYRVDVKLIAHDPPESDGLKPTFLRFSLKPHVGGAFQIEGNRPGDEGHKDFEWTFRKPDAYGAPPGPPVHAPEFKCHICPPQGSGEPVEGVLGTSGNVWTSRHSNPVRSRAMRDEILHRVENLFSNNMQQLVYQLLSTITLGPILDEDEFDDEDAESEPAPDDEGAAEDEDESEDDGADQQRQVFVYHHPRRKQLQCVLPFKLRDIRAKVPSEFQFVTVIEDDYGETTSWFRGQSLSDKFKRKGPFYRGVVLADYTKLEESKRKARADIVEASADTQSTPFDQLPRPEVGVVEATAPADGAPPKIEYVVGTQATFVLSFFPDLTIPPGRPTTAQP